MRKLIIIGIMTVYLSACQTMQPKVVQLNNTITVSELKALRDAKGKNTIKGSALIRQGGGGVVTCAGNEVNMIPVTPYSKERAIHIYGNSIEGYRPAIMPQVIFQPDIAEFTAPDYRFSTMCDAQGFFKFENVADGEYYLATFVVWKVGNSLQGGALMKKVSVANGENKDIVLTVR